MGLQGWDLRSLRTTEGGSRLRVRHHKGRDPIGVSFRRCQPGQKTVGLQPWRSSLTRPVAKLPSNLVVEPPKNSLCEFQVDAFGVRLCGSVGFMEHSGVNPRSQVDVTELCSVKSTCDDLQSSTENLQHDMVFSSY